MKTYELGHPVINPFGQVILISRPALKLLDIKQYLKRDRESGLKAVTRSMYLVYLEMERGTELFRELGEDFSGPNVVKCNCEECKEKISKDPLINDIRTRQVA